MSFKQFYLKEILASYLGNKSTDEIEDDNCWNCYSLAEVGFLKLWGLQAGAVTDEEYDSLELIDWGTALIVPDKPEYDFDVDSTSSSVELEESEELLSEKITKKKVIRKGVRIIKYVTDKPGFRIEFKDGRPREDRMSAVEKRKRQIAQTKASRKRKGKSKTAQRKRALSMKKRSSQGLK